MKAYTIALVALVGLSGCSIDPAPPVNGVTPAIAVATFKNKCLQAGFSNRRQVAAFGKDTSFEEVPKDVANLQFQGTPYAHKVLGMIGVAGSAEGKSLCAVGFAPTKTVSQSYRETWPLVMRQLGQTVPVSLEGDTKAFPTEGGVVLTSIGDDRATIFMILREL